MHGLLFCNRLRPLLNNFSNIVQICLIMKCIHLTVWAVSLEEYQRHCKGIIYELVGFINDVADFLIPMNKDNLTCSLSAFKRKI